MTKLNYEAEAPQPTGPFTVKVEQPKNPPGDFRFKDYIPKEQPKPREEKKGLKDNVMRRPIARFESDYISGADAAVKRSGEKSKIMELAKQIYTDHNKRKKEYDEALAMIDAASTQEKENPDTKLAKAIRIAKKIQPITKEQAIEAAEKQFYGTLS